MTKIMIWISLMVLTGMSSFAGASSVVEGKWQYTGYKYEGIHYPASTGLQLVFQFHPDGTVNLKWFYEGESGFCERIAEFEVIKESWLFQKVTWVNPNNDARCSNDSDMIMGRQTMTQFQTTEAQLVFVLELNGKPLFYNLNRVPNAGI